jgi:hypothetical protein
MNAKTLAGLIVAVVLVLVVAAAVGHWRKPRGEPAGGSTQTALVPSLRDHVNDVDRVVVVGAGGKTLATLSRGANGWSIAEKNDFAVDTGKLRELLLKLADAKLVEQKTSNPEKYATLGVEDVAGADAKGVEIDLGGLREPVKLIVGTANARGGTFVRRAGEAESWLVSGNVNVDRKVENWLRKDVADVAANRVQSVTLTRPDGKIVRITKNAEADASFTLADVPKGREPAEFAINAIPGTLAGLRFDDVVAAKDAPPPEKPLDARFATFDGLVVDVVAWEKDGKNYAQLSASVNRDAKPADDKAAAIEKEAKDLDARAKGWTYVLPAYKYANLNKSIDDLLKPLEKKPDAKSTAKKPAPAKKS